VIDSHLHLNRPELAEDRDEILARAAAAGVRGFLNVGYDPASSRASVQLAAEDARILASVGIHPHDASLLADAEGRPVAEATARLDELRELARRPGVVAVGEIGLDFYRDLSPRPAQRTALGLQLELAKELDLPVIFHIRDAYAETLALVDALGLPPRRAVLHSFAGDVAAARWARERGCLLGIGGPVTYRKSHLPAVLQEAAVTAAEVLLETDAPWLPPVPHRGERNEPAYLVHTRDRLAEFLGVAPGELAARSTENFARLFGRLPGALDGLAAAPLE
jgi:TatD DNase family protein